MNTPAHLILGLAALGRPASPAVTVAALAGALLPDLSLYLLAGGALALGVPARRVFDELYFSEAWQTVFAIDNSMLVWGAALALGLWLGRDCLVALAAAALLHVATDLPLHHDDGRPHFWPLTDWVFASPVSYWDPDHHGATVSAIETALAVALAAWSWIRFRAAWVRALLALLVAAQLSVGGVWIYVFS